MPINILHVFRAPVGGLFRHVVDLVRGQIACGHRVGIIADSLTGNARSDEIFADLAPRLALGLTRIPMHRQLNPLDAPAVFHVTRRIQQTGADVIHGHGAKGGAYARLAVPGRRVVRAYTPHGGSLLLSHDNWSGRLYLTLERILLARPALFLFESAYSGVVFRQKIGEPNGIVRVIHNGVSRSEFEPVAPVPDATDLVFIGEFRPVKGIDILIDAIARLHATGRPVTATLVGSGPDEAALKAQVERLSLRHAIRFVPATPAREALAFGRVMVIPSRAESLPYVVLEAAAAAKPLITTNVGGIPEIFGPLSKALIEPGKAQALADAIARTIGSPAAAEHLAQQLRDRVAASFSIDAMVDGVLSAYREAMAEAIPVQIGALAQK
ncbi:glycosyltransferase family 4 protein [Pseudorhodoplanes sp.]|uniref:glycosyltransferase family 4 protein n=1 Tax=Pseudorhodoplanes sp. TaxID=1934341 RepID=UPI003D1216A9